ncbi:MAG: hypothetical protein WAM53_02745, partial [Terrimicrobiaceae bacterium]
TAVGNTTSAAMAGMGMGITSGIEKNMSDAPKDVFPIEFKMFSTVKFSNDGFFARRSRSRSEVRTVSGVAFALARACPCPDLLEGERRFVLAGRLARICVRVSVADFTRGALRDFVTVAGGSVFERAPPALADLRGVTSEFSGMTACELIIYGTFPGSYSHVKQGGNFNH